jgi:hypothetical protein
MFSGASDAIPNQIDAQITNGVNEALDMSLSKVNGAASAHISSRHKSCQQHSNQRQEGTASLCCSRTSCLTSLRMNTAPRKCGAFASMHEARCIRAPSPACRGGKVREPRSLWLVQPDSRSPPAPFWCGPFLCRGAHFIYRERVQMSSMNRLVALQSTPVVSDPTHSLSCRFIFASINVNSARVCDIFRTYETQRAASAPHISQTKKRF